MRSRRELSRDSTCAAATNDGLAPLADQRPEAEIPWERRPGPVGTGCAEDVQTPMANARGRTLRAGAWTVRHGRNVVLNRHPTIRFLREADDLPFLKTRFFTSNLLPGGLVSKAFGFSKSGGRRSLQAVRNGWRTVRTVPACAPIR